MNIVKNLSVVAGAPLQAVSLLELFQILEAYANADHRFVIMSKFVGPMHSTTIYDATARQLYRATHRRGQLRLFKEIADGYANIRILGAKEVLTKAEVA